MSIGAELGQYCLPTKLKKNSEDSMGGGSLNADRLTYSYSEWTAG